MEGVIARVFAILTVNCSYYL